MRRHVLMCWLCWACLLLIGGLTLSANNAVYGEDRPAVVVGEPQKIVVEPATFQLHGTRAQQQLSVVGHYANGEVRDLTPVAQFTSNAETVAKVTGSVVKPVTDGNVQITATVGTLTATADGVAQKMAQPALVSFKNGTIPALSKASCNMGACHGSPSGKAGFRLSLRGYDPELDIMTLRTEFYGRRVNNVEPAESLLLKKPLMEVAHGGGRRIKKSDPAYQVLHDWIAEGLRKDSGDEPNLEKIQMLPESRTFLKDGNQQQAVVLGYFSDGSIRDVTPLTVFTSSNENVARAGEDGLVTKVARGETAILARYQDKMATSYMTFLEDVPGFVWSNPPENSFVDTLINVKLKQLQILPSDLCTDEEFLRRAYLDVTGRLPNVSEANAFLTNPSDKRREELVDLLVDSDDYASFWALKWADILRSNSKKLNATGVHKFRMWIYEGLRNDKPFDQFARELLTAKGSVYENPAASYWRASRDPQDATETTAQLFLGIRIQCAKCHNHPFERWTQDNYYGIGAAFARIGRKPTADPTEEIIFVAEGGEVTQPRTGQVMKTHLLLKGDVDVPAGQDRREVFAEWLTAADNPFFSRAAVNRVWGHLMGRGIVEPVDDFRDSNPPSNAPLLDKLAQEFAANNFSLKWAVKTILKSRTYQLSSRKNQFNADDEIYASHAATRLLSAEQLLDAICAVTNVPESFPGLPAGTRATELPDPPTDHYFLKIFGQPQREMACQCERSNESNLSQALQMINGPVVHNKLRDNNGRIAQMVTASKPNEEIVTDLYLAALSRKPAAGEMEAALKHIAAAMDRRLALEDVGWAILNSKEFLFQH